MAHISANKFLDVDCEAIKTAGALADGDAVPALTNSVAGQNSGSQATAANRAAILHNARNNRAAATFDGINDFYDFGNLFTGKTKLTIYALVKIDSPLAAESSTGFWRGAAGSGSHYSFTDGVIYDGIGSTTRKTIGKPFDSLTYWRLYTVVSDAGDYRVYLDGELVFQTATNTVAMPPLWEFGRSAADSIFYYFKGQMLRLLAFDSAHTPTQIAQETAEFESEYVFLGTADAGDTGAGTVVTDLDFQNLGAGNLPPGFVMRGNVVNQAVSGKTAVKGTVIDANNSLITEEFSAASTNRRVSARMRLSVSPSAPNGYQACALVARASRDDYNHLSGYALFLTDIGVTLYYRSCGQFVALSDTLNSLVRSAVYDASIETNGDLISGFVQRFRDKKWLTATGTWATMRQACVSVRDGSRTLRGRDGLLTYFTGTAQSPEIFNFKVTRLPVPAVVAELPTERTFYVDSDGGNDANNGTSAGNAWATLDKINNLFSANAFLPGDKILFKSGGVWSGNLVARASGTKVNPITIGRYGSGELPQINAGDGSGAKVLDCEYVTVRDLKLRGSGVSPINGATTSTGAGVDLHSTHTNGERWRGVRVLNNDIDGFRTGILVRGDSGVYPQLTYRGFADFEISGNKIRHGAVAGIYTWALSNLPADLPGDGRFPMLSSVIGVHQNAKILNNDVRDIYGRTGATYQLAYSGAGIRLCNLSGGLVAGNLSDNAGHSGTGLSFPASFECESSSDLVFAFNESSRCKLFGIYDGAGFDVFDANTKDICVFANYIHDNDGYGVGGGSYNGYGTTSGNHIVAYNITKNNNKNDNDQAEVHFWRNLNSVWVFNNIFDATGDTLSKYSYKSDDFNSFDIKLFNNILLCNGGRHHIYKTNGTLCQNNIYWSPSGGFRAFSGGVEYTSLTAWRAGGENQEKIGATPVGKVTDPRFVLPPPSPEPMLPANDPNALTNYDPLDPSIIAGGVDLYGAYRELERILGEYELELTDFHKTRGVRTIGAIGIPLELKILWNEAIKVFLPTIGDFTIPPQTVGKVLEEYSILVARYDPASDNYTLIAAKLDDYVPPTDGKIDVRLGATDEENFINFRGEVIAPS